MRAVFPPQTAQHNSSQRSPESPGLHCSPQPLPSGRCGAGSRAPGREGAGEETPPACTVLTSLQDIREARGEEAVPPAVPWPSPVKALMQLWHGKQPSVLHAAACLHDTALLSHLSHLIGGEGAEQMLSSQGWDKPSLAVVSFLASVCLLNPGRKALGQGTGDRTLLPQAGVRMEELDSVWRHGPHGTVGGCGTPNGRGVFPK